MEKTKIVRVAISRISWEVDSQKAWIRTINSINEIKIDYYWIKKVNYAIEQAKLWPDSPYYRIEFVSSIPQQWQCSHRSFQPFSSKGYAKLSSWTIKNYSYWPSPRNYIFSLWKKWIVNSEIVSQIQYGNKVHLSTNNCALVKWAWTSKIILYFAQILQF